MLLSNFKYHGKCLKCVNCKKKLTETAMLQNDDLYCHECYARTFYKCEVCKILIRDFDTAVMVNDHAYHRDCFNCQQCQGSLLFGEDREIDPNTFLPYHELHMPGNDQASREHGHEEHHDGADNRLNSVDMKNMTEGKRVELVPMELHLAMKSEERDVDATDSEDEENERKNRELEEARSHMRTDGVQGLEGFEEDMTSGVPSGVPSRGQSYSRLPSVNQ